jgi:glycosyltransferase involved in cell wall biosynthesis
LIKYCFLIQAFSQNIVLLSRLKMKQNSILFALNGFFPKNSAGTEVYVLGLARFLREQNYDVGIIIPSAEGLDSKYEYDGFPVYQYPVSKIVSSARINKQQSQIALDCFLKILNFVKPNIIHFHSYNRAMNSSHIKLAHDMGIKTVFTSHLAGIFCARGDLFYKNTRPCDGKIRLHRCMSCFIQQKYKLSNSSGLIAIGMNLFIILFPWIRRYKPSLNFIKYKKKELNRLNKYSDKIISISKWMLNAYALNGITKAIIACQEVSKNNVEVKTHLYTKNKINLIFVGRLYPIKNIELLLEALSVINISRSIYHSKLEQESCIQFEYRTPNNKNRLAYSFDLTMVIIPNENRMDYYHRIKEKYVLQGYNKWYEKVSQEKVKNLLKSSDLLCLLSISEVAPMVIKEAFNCGVPVLGSDIPPISELVTHGKNGLLFETNNLDSLKEQLSNLVADKNLLAILKNNVCPMTDIAEVYKAIEKQYK